MFGIASFLSHILSVEENDAANVVFLVEKVADESCDRTFLIRVFGVGVLLADEGENDAACHCCYLDDLWEVLGGWWVRRMLTRTDKKKKGRSHFYLRCRGRG